MSTSSEPVVLQGMGAIPHDKGVAFRVWAPHAEKVFVMGTFNRFSETASPMAAEKNGNWYANIESAKPGDEYRYLVINGEQKLSRIDPRAFELTNSTGNGIVHNAAFDWQGDTHPAMPHWNEAVIYEMHIGTFSDNPGGEPGTFDTAIHKLGHLKKLGINVIQMMPVWEFPGDFSWGYNPSQIFAVESAYGGLDGFRRFIREAHRQGFAVILDVVYNHFGPFDMDMWLFDGWEENGGGGIYFYNDWKKETPWGDTRPDYGRGEVRQFIHDNVFHWVTNCHVDGLRWDMTLYMRTVRGNQDNRDEELPDGWTLMQWINRELHQQYPSVLTIAEDLQKNEWLVKSDGAGGAGFGSQWAAGFVHPIRETVIALNDESRDMNVVVGAVNLRYDGGAFKRVIYSESHDEVANGHARVVSEIDWDDPRNHYAVKRSTLAAALVLTAPGIPMLFQGQEFLEGEWFRDDVPLEWDLADDFQGVIRLYRDMIMLRRNGENSTRGLTGEGMQVFHVNHLSKVIAFHRWYEGGPRDDVVVVANFSNTAFPSYTLGFPRAGLWKLRINTDWRGYGKMLGNFHSYDTEADAIEFDGMPARGNIGLPSYSVVMFSQDE